jgi:hypothetical protein
MAGQFGLQFRHPQGSLTCHKSATWDRQLYFTSEGRHAVDFFARTIQRLWPGSNPRCLVPEASMLTTIAPKPLIDTVVYHIMWLSCLCVSVVIQSALSWEAQQTEPWHTSHLTTLYDKPPYRSVFSRNSDGSRSSLKMADYCWNM